METPKYYNPKEVEKNWQKFWEDNKINSFNAIIKIFKDAKK